jgi:HEPN domain-containing protein
MSELTTDDRTTALGLFNYARSYRASADHLLSAKLKVPHPHAPLTFLYYHAVELYLKAYLRVQGYTVAQLKSVGHNVSKLSTEVQSRGLILDDEDREVLSSIAEGDNVIRSRYIQIGAFTRPEEEALSRTCAALEDSVAKEFEKAKITILPYIPAPSSSSTTETSYEAIREELRELNVKEREIIAYLLHRGERMFTADLDGGHATTLISRGIVQRSLRQGQAFDPSDVPMEIPRSIWNIIKTMKDQFPYSGDEDDPHPWRVGFYDRI